MPTLTEAIQTIRAYCQKTRCEDCQFHREHYTQGLGGDGDIHYLSCKLEYETPEDWDFKIYESNIYDKRTVVENAIVEILENTKTGETSIGWYENK
jgi:hypothetical protein